VPDRDGFLDRLDDYLAGELDAAARDAFEDELFGADTSGSLIAEHLAMHDGIRFIGRAMGGSLSPVMRQTNVEALLRSGHNVVEFPMSAGEELAAPFPKKADYLVAHLSLPPEADGRLVVEFIGGEDEPTQLRMRVTDAPWDRDARRLTIACERHIAERDRVTRFRVLREGATEPLAEYTIRTLR
jgi:hypothetical protein